MQTFMILKHYNVRKNILKFFHADLKEDSISHSKDLFYKQEKKN